ncbi:hypothetical protein [Tardiphaga sp. 862_B3_N1_1]|uniref:hypothetical protein n=1 Tax=Tardiphaga sp. 862_B3_N1_1 TaxID=3240763 RepID=UPI003F8C1C66
MSVLNPIPAAQIARNYTHKGWLGFCPVYVRYLSDSGVDVAERNGVPEWVLVASLAMQDFCNWCLSAIDPGYVPGWIVRTTGALPRAGGEQ